MRRFLLPLCLALPLLGAPDWNTLNHGIVKVEAANKAVSDTGAGIVIAASSDSIRILTAAHVVAEASSWKVYFYSDQAVAYRATLLPRSSDSLDLAVLEVLPQGRPLPANLPRLPMRDPDPLRVDDHIWTVDSEWVHIPNMVVRLDHDSDTRLFEYTKREVGDGFSGGPVFDEDGLLAGIHHGGGAGGRYAVAVKLESTINALATLGHNASNLARGGTVVPRLGDTQVNTKDGLTYVWVPAGSFTMGCSPGDGECYDNEKPPHSEQIAKGFWLGRTEVTQAAWAKVKGDDPSYFDGAQLPVESVDWRQAASYCKDIGGRLPTEKEWEYAARAGAPGARYGPLNGVAWYDENSGSTTHPVGLKQANGFGLYDMLGNVWEWTADYDRAGGRVVVRGGAWGNDSRDVRASLHSRGEPASRFPDTGFRCVAEFH